MITGMRNVRRAAAGSQGPGVGKHIAASISSSPYVAVVDTDTWTLVSGLPELAGLGTGGVAFSPDGSLLALGHRNRPGLTVLDTSTWQIVPGTPNSNVTGYGVAFSPDGNLLAFAQTSRLAVLNTGTWDSHGAATGADFYGVAFSPDGGVIGATHSNRPGQPRLYQVNPFQLISGTPSVTKTGGQYSLGAAFSPDGRYFAFGTQDTAPYFHVLDRDTDSYVGVPSLGRVNQVAFSPDGTRLAVASTLNRLTVFDTNSWTATYTHDTAAGGVSYSLDGSLLYYTRASTLYVLDALTLTEVNTVPLGGIISQIAVSPY